MSFVHPTILLVDDNDDIREPLALLMRASGYAVETARTGEEALAAMRRAKPCIILLDLMMPDVTGHDIRMEQLADPEISHIPVVLFSASFDIQRAAMELGAAAYATKPAEFAPLMELIRRHCLK
jgi:CheY-like chemotaxis protein